MPENICAQFILYVFMEFVSFNDVIDKLLKAGQSY